MGKARKNKTYMSRIRNIILIKMSEYNRNKKRKQKELLVKRKGGKCEKCGYSKNMSALQFHHPNGRNGKIKQKGRFILSTENPQSKAFNINEVILVCANCHLELHHPELTV